MSFDRDSIIYTRIMRILDVLRCLSFEVMPQFHENHENLKIHEKYERGGSREASALRVPRAVTRLTVYRPLGILDTSKGSQKRFCLKTN